MWWIIAALFVGHFIGFMAAALCSAAGRHHHPCPHCNCDL